MGKRLGGLWILLALQILAAIWLWWPRASGAVTGQPWLSFSPQDVTQITFTDGSSDKHVTLTLQKHDGAWRLPKADDFPADGTKVKHLLHAVAGLKGTLPVAVTHDAARRFHVAKDRFQTRVALNAGSKTVAKFYVGNAAGANRVYLRRAGSNVIEANALPSWLVSSSVSDWRDHDLLHLSADKVEKLVLPHVTLVKQKDAWKAAGTSGAIDEDKVKSLVQHLTQLDFDGVAEKQAEHPLKASFKVSVNEDGKTLTYAFAKVPAKGDQSHAQDKQHTKPRWHMTRSDLPYVFTVSGDDVKPLRDATAASLAQQAKKPKAATDHSAPVPAHKS